MGIGERIIAGSQNTLSALQLIYDYYKHITTLSLGVVLFISAFLKIGKAGGIQEVFIVISIIAFLLSIVFSLKIMKYISSIMNYSSSTQGFAQLIDASELLGVDQQKKELTKLGIQMNALMEMSYQESKRLKKWIQPTWIAFVCGVIFAVCFILAPILNRLLESFITEPRII